MAMRALTAAAPFLAPQRRQQVSSVALCHRVLVAASGSCCLPRVGVRSVSVFNSLSGAVEPIAPPPRPSSSSPPPPGPLTWYSCGPTVYDSAHVGHARTYVSLDILRRVTERRARRSVLYCMGVTDIDDKILARARELRTSPAALARRFEAEFEADMAALGVLPPSVTTRVTAHVPAIVAYVRRIVDNGLAYVIPGDGVYMDTGAMGGAYGVMAPWSAAAKRGAGATGDEKDDGSAPSSASDNAAEAASGEARMRDAAPPAPPRGAGGVKIAPESDGHQSDSPPPPPVAPSLDGGVGGGASRVRPAVAALKRDAKDFALWKLSASREAAAASSPPGAAPPLAAAPDDEESWPSPWGRGRPGWHIECSAMTHAVFGRHLDVHAGGVDLRFPHHCNEVAQCAAHNAYAPEEGPWARVFVHTGHVHIDGRKMSKSLKNFITIREMLAARPGGRRRAAAEFRIFCLSHRYRSNVTFGNERMEEASALLNRLQNCAREVKALTSQPLRSDASSSSPPPSLPSSVSTSAASREPHPLSSGFLTPAGRALLERAYSSHATMMAALESDFDTATALRELVSLSGAVSAAAVALRSWGGEISEASGATPAPPPLGTILEAHRIITGFLDIVGLDVDCEGGDEDVSAATAASSSATHVAAFNALVDFRQSVRAAAIAAVAQLKRKKNKAKASGVPVSEAQQPEEAAAATAAAVSASLQSIIASCDHVRDVTAPSLGLKISDSPLQNTPRVPTKRE